MPPTNHSRRDFLCAAGGALVSGGLAALDSQAEEPRHQKKMPRVAAINSIYRLRSHAYHICGRFIHGYSREGIHHQPPFELVRMYNDQYPPDDLSREIGARHGVEVCSSVRDALGGSKGLDV